MQKPELQNTDINTDKSKGEKLVTVENLGKIFCRDLKRSLYYGLVDSFNDLIPGLNSRRQNNVGEPVLRKQEFWANTGISFDLKRGECLGLIGRNGAGKTSLLKMLSGLIKPDYGRIEMRGRVGTLIALGAGFNPILTGRENVFINGSVLGLSKKEIDNKFDEIVEFAEMDEFIDSPVQNYSSGMQVRLGFAVASKLNPDVLLLDEVLAVGDAAFRSKCYTQIGKLLKSAAVILVSHSMSQIALICDKVLLLDRGRSVHFGGVSQGISDYEKLSHKNDDNDDAFVSCELPVVQFSSTIINKELSYDGGLNLELQIDLADPFDDIWLRIIFYADDGTMIGEWDSLREDHIINLMAGSNLLRITFEPFNFKRGKYSLGIQMSDKGGLIQFVWSYKNSHFRILNDEGGFGYVRIMDREIKLLS